MLDREPLFHRPRRSKKGSVRQRRQKAEIRLQPEDPRNRCLYRTCCFGICRRPEGRKRFGQLLCVLLKHGAGGGDLFGRRGIRLGAGIKCCNGGVDFCNSSGLLVHGGCDASHLLTDPVDGQNDAVERLLSLANIVDACLDLFPGGGDDLRNLRYGLGGTLCE